MTPLSLLSSAHLVDLSTLSLATLFLNRGVCYPHRVPLIPNQSFDDITTSFPSLLAERVHERASRLCFICLCFRNGGLL
jgi:hypothetical protein